MDWCRTKCFNSEYKKISNFNSLVAQYCMEMLWELSWNCAGLCNVLGWDVISGPSILGQLQERTGMGWFTVEQCLNALSVHNQKQKTAQTKFSLCITIFLTGICLIKPLVISLSAVKLGWDTIHRSVSPTSGLCFHSSFEWGHQKQTRSSVGLLQVHFFLSCFREQL